MPVAPLRCAMVRSAVQSLSGQAEVVCGMFVSPQDNPMRPKTDVRVLADRACATPSRFMLAATTLAHR